MIEKSVKQKISLLCLVVLCFMFIIIVRLFFVQVIYHQYYVDRVKIKSQLTIRLPAVRGEICDRNGLPLVENRASIEIAFYLPDIVHAWKEEKGSVPIYHYRSLDHGMITNKEIPDIIKIINESIIPKLRAIGLPTYYNEKKLLLHYRDNKEIPFIYSQDTDFNSIARLSEQNIDMIGVVVALKPVRHYLYGAFASHIFGYIGQPSSISREEKSHFTFYQSDMEGKAEIEKVYNQTLRGEAGIKYIQCNAKGSVDGEISTINPKKGNRVFLTIDARIQYITEKVMRSVGRGAAIVMNPNNGEILAMVSVPSFDPNVFIPSISQKDWSKLCSDRTNPLINRAINAYAPGSIFKICTSLAGLYAGIGSNIYECSGGVQYGNKYMKCWVLTGKVFQKPHGKQGLSDALKNSCNAYFFQYGNAAGIHNIDTVGSLLQLGKKTGLPLNNEASGVLPGPEWLSKMYPQERWSSGYTANVAIGQGYVLVTPIQMVNMVSCIANGGKIYRPHLISKIVKQDGTILQETHPELISNLSQTLSIQSEKMEKIRLGLWKVVNDSNGTAKRAYLKNIVVAGKTGTAQFWRGREKDNHAWFICFAPFNNPRYAICVFVQGAKSGGTVAAPIAAKILSDILDQSNKQLILKPLPPALGSFQQIDSINFNSISPTVFDTESNASAKVIKPTQNIEKKQPINNKKVSHNRI